MESVRQRRQNVEYTRVKTSDDVDGFVDEQFVEQPRPFPCKTVIFVIGFMILGGICLTLSILISGGHLDENYRDRGFPLLILGIIMFIPGGYYGYILLCICLKRGDFTWDDVPVF